MFRIALTLSLSATTVATVTGCVTQPDAVPNNAASIEYQLPVSAVQIKVDLTLERCAKGTTDKDNLDAIKAKATLSTVPVVRPSPYAEHYFRIYGADLVSFNKKRDLKMELYPIGSVKSINGAISDRTGAIFAGILKLATVAATWAMEIKTSPIEGQCNKETLEALKDAVAIKSAIAALQDSLATGSAADPAAVRKSIDALAVEHSRIQIEALSLSLERTIDFWASPEDATEGGIIRWKQSELRKWFGNDTLEDEPVSNFALAYCVEKAKRGQATVEPTPCNIHLAQGARREPASKGADIKCANDSGKCRTTIVFREPAESTLTVVTVKADINNKQGDRKLGQATLPIAQWGDVTYFPLTAGFGETKSLVLALDEHGRRTSFGWSSGARGEEIFGGVQSIADSAVAYRTLRDGEDLKAAKAEVDALETQQKLNKLKKCQAVLDAGGFVCPEQ